MKNLLILTFCFLSAIGLSQQNANEPYIFNENTSAFAPKTYAIVIGVSSYPNLTQSKQLKWADNDALMVLEHMRTQPNTELYLYTNEDATDPLALGKKIHEILSKKAGQLDKVIIYFSGHGDISSQDQNGYLLLSQVEKPTVTPYHWSDAIPIEKIKSSILASNVKKENVYLIFDACKSGYAMANVTGANFIEHQKIVMMLSSQANQDSQEIDELKHSAFTYYLVQGMNGLADLNEGNEITFSELRQYVSKNVIDVTEGAQTPLFHNINDSDVCSIYTENELEKANKEQSEIQSMNYTASLKGTESKLNTLPQRCKELHELMNAKAQQGVFFQDEIDLSEQLLKIGTLEGKYESKEPIQFLENIAGNKFVMIEGGKGLVFSDRNFKNPMQLGTGGTTAIACSPNGRLICTASDDLSIELWNPLTGDALEFNLALEDEVSSLIFISENEIIAGTTNGKIYTIDLTEQKTTKLKVAKSAIKKIKIFNEVCYVLSSDGILTLVDLKNRVKLSQHKLNATDFELLTETNRLLTVGGTKLVNYELGSFKELNAIEFKSTLTSIGIDPLEKYALIGNSGRSVELIEIFNFIEKKSPLKTKSGVKSIDFLPGQNKVILVDESNNVEIADFNVNLGQSAFNLKQLILNCNDDPELVEEINGELVEELNDHVKPIIKLLITDRLNEVSEKDLKTALRYSKEAYELGKDLVLDPQQLQINILLIEAYSVLKSGDRSEFAKGLKALDQIKELDPSSSYAHTLSAQFYLKMNNLERAKDELSKAESIAPNWATPKIIASEILIDEKKYDEAIAKVESIIAIDEEHAQAYSALSNAQLMAGKTEAARSSVEKAIALDKKVTLSDTVSKKFADLSQVKTINNSEFNNAYKAPTPKNTKKEVRNDLNENVDLRDGLQVGDFYEGGTVFYIDATGRHGLVAAYQSLYEPMSWDEGMNRILKMELNGYDDWKMPSIEEMKIFSLSRVYAPVSVFWTSAKYHLVPGHIMWFDTNQKIFDHTKMENKRYILPIREF